MIPGGISAAAVVGGFNNYRKHKVWEKKNREKRKLKKEELKNKYSKLMSSEDSKILAKIVSSRNYVECSDRKCPECQEELEVFNIKDQQIDFCKRCDSYWFDKGELSYITGFEKDTPSDDLASRESKYLCPVCQSKMIEHVFLKPHNLLVDQCPEGHGVYLESGELDRVVEIAG